jgi:hypothetical protein
MGYFTKDIIVVYVRRSNIGTQQVGGGWVAYKYYKRILSQL